MDKIQKCFIIYADILGYKNRILQCQNNFKKLSEELDQIRKVITPTSQYLGKGISYVNGEIKFFSDNLLITIPFPCKDPQEEIQDGKVEIWRTLEELADYQFQLALDDVFIRGCAEIGFAYSDDLIVFSPELLTLVECEKKSVYPRICLQPNSISLIKSICEKKWLGWERIQALCLRDSDGRIFLNYLYSVQNFISDNGDEIPEDGGYVPWYLNFRDALGWLRQHKERIEENIKKNSEVKTLEKFYWLAEYHNYFINQYFQEMKDLLISDPLIPEMRREFTPLIPGLMINTHGEVVKI